MTIPTTLTVPGGVTPTRGELEADPLAVAVSAAASAMLAETTGDASSMDMDDPSDREELAALVRHLRAAGVDVVAPC